MVYFICRLEKIVFGDTSDIINNLLVDKSDIKITDETVDETVDDEDVIDDNNTKPEEKKAAWIDEDDYNYT